jgi:hypothetical protein
MSKHGAKRIQKTGLVLHAAYSNPEIELRDDSGYFNQKLTLVTTMVEGPCIEPLLSP